MAATFLLKGSRPWAAASTTNGIGVVVDNTATFLVLLARWDSTDAPSSLTDNKGNTWVSCGHHIVSGTRLQAWYVASTVDTGSTVADIAFSSAPGNLEAVIMNYTFTPAASPVDVFAVTTTGGGGTSMTTGAFSTAQDTELAIVALHGVSGFTAGSGYTKRSDESFMGVQDQFFSSIQSSVTATMTSGGSSGPMWVVTFKEVGGSGGSPPAGTVTISGVTPGVTTATVTYSYDDTDEDSFEYRIDGGTAAAIGASPATITGLTASTAYDSPGVQVRAVNTDGEGDWSTAFDFTTNAPNDPPSWSGTPSAMSAKRGQAMTPQDITSLVSDSDALTYSLGGTPPTGVSIDSSTGIISGTPTSAPGVYSTTVLADDGVNSPVASSAFNITVTQCVLALSGVGYEFMNGNSPETAAIVASTTLNVAAYPASEWPPASAVATASGATDGDGNLADLGDDDLTFGTTYRLVARNPSNGETWAWTMTAS
jgi:hypothetical protein